MLKRLFISIIATSTITASVLSASLGPSSNGTIGSDPNTLNELQPASPSNLQSADSRSGGINQPSSGNSLQPAGSRDDFPANLDISTSGDGSQHTLDDNSSNHTNQIILALIGVLMFLCAVFTFRISKLLEAKNVSYNPSTFPDSGLEHDPHPESEPEQILPATDSTNPNIEPRDEDTLPEKEAIPTTPEVQPDTDVIAPPQTLAKSPKKNKKTKKSTQQKPRGEKH